MATRKKQRSWKTAIPGLLKILEKVSGLDSKQTLEAKIDEHHLLFHSELAVGADRLTNGKRSGRGPDSMATMWPNGSTADKVGWSGSYQHFGHASVERAVKDGLHPDIAQFIRRQILEEISSAHQFIKELEITLQEQKERLSKLKECKKQLDRWERQLMNRSWNGNISRNLAEAVELMGIIEVCDSEIGSICRQMQYLKKAVKLTRRLERTMSSKAAARNIKLARLMKDIDLFKELFPRKLDWQRKLESYWLRKFKNQGLLKNQGIHEHMASILGISRESVAARLSRHNFRIT
tara:strand:+ start:476 stop:1354 length:879 start_codon:yes stop_codon:yes gene_type:complete